MFVLSECRTYISKITFIYCPLLIAHVSGHGGVQRPAASEAAQTVPTPPPPSEGC